MDRGLIRAFNSLSMALTFDGNESGEHNPAAIKMDGNKAGEPRIMSEQMGSGDFADLVHQMEQSADDPRQCYALVKQRISEFRHSGRAVPDELSKLEKSIMTECMLASQGR